MIDRQHIPFSTTLPDFKFPEFEQINLENGLKVYFIQDTSQPLAAFNIFTKKGAFADTIEGTTNITAQMLTRGTSKHTYSEIASMTENIGTVLKATPGYDANLLSSVSLGKFLDTAIDIATECFLDSQIPKDELEKVIQKQKANIMQQNSNISYLAKYALQKTIFVNTGYAKCISGNMKSVENISRDIVWNNYIKNIKSANPSIFLTGNYDKDFMMKKIEKLYGKLAFESDKQDDSIPINPGAISLVDKPSSNQSSIILARKMIDIKHPDFPYVQLVNTIFGGFFMSRLNKILREDKGYTYGVHSSFDIKKLSVLHVISSNVNIDKTAESIEIIRDEYKKLRLNPITEEELKRARQYYYGAFLRNVETPLQVASMLRNMDLYDLDFNYYNNLLQKISNVKLDKLHTIVEKHFNSNNFVIAVAGDLKIIQSQMKKFGSINIISIEN